MYERLRLEQLSFRLQTPDRHDLTSPLAKVRYCRTVGHFIFSPIPEQFILNDVNALARCNGHDRDAGSGIYRHVELNPQIWMSHGADTWPPDGQRCAQCTDCKSTSTLIMVNDGLNLAFGLQGVPVASWS